MSDLDALLAGIVAHPHEHLRWLIMADWLDDHGFPERAELVRVHRELLRTCTDPDAYPERWQLHARMMELMRAGVQPCIPEKTLTLPGGVELKMSFIPPGSFLMGSPVKEEERSDDETRHLVTLTRGFWLGQSPVTQPQWLAVMGTDPSGFYGHELPVEKIGSFEAEEFCGQLVDRTGMALRLPTEGEWEYACRAGTTTPFYWGYELNGTQANCDGREPYDTRETGPNRLETTTVGSFATVSPHPWSLLDMSGNVFEWCADWYDHYPAGEATDPTGSEFSTVRVLRGGCWQFYGRTSRSACRYSFMPDTRMNCFGFRIAADLE